VEFEPIRLLVLVQRLRDDDAPSRDDLLVAPDPSSSAPMQLDEFLQPVKWERDRGLRRVVIGLSWHVLGLSAEVDGCGETADGS